jgi:hypothetical protein
MSYSKGDFFCCHPTCPKDAEFIVIDESDCDPYTRETHSCDRCVGALLGHCTIGTVSGPGKWSIYPIEEVYDIQ